MEATHQGEPPEEGPRNLLTAREAGRWAARAGAHRLLLTHFWPGLDRSVSVAEAGEGFRGEIIAATEDLTITLE
jgi:ribonuclease BN (tRNA processing enzyme)